MVIRRYLTGPGAHITHGMKTATLLDEGMVLKQGPYGESCGVGFSIYLVLEGAYWFSGAEMATPEPRDKNRIIKCSTGQ